MIKTLTVLLTVSAFSVSAVAAQGDTGDRNIIFGSKIFVDNFDILGGFVSISGTITGHGLGYKHNTVNISCYRDRMECWSFKIEQIAFNQIGDLHSPNVFLIRIWNGDKVAADNGTNCPRISITLDRKTQTAIWVQGVSNANSDLEDNPCAYPDKQTYEWTIEDPPQSR